MGHHGRQYGFGQSEHGRAAGLAVLGRMPRGLKIVLALVALFILLVGLAVAALVVLLLVKVVAGGTLPGYFQEALDFAQRNLQPLLSFWKTLQGLTGK